MEQFQKCYKKRKGFGNIPQKITITEVSGDNVTFVWGHYDREEFEYTTGFMGGRAKRKRSLRTSRTIKRERSERKMSR